MKAGKKYKHIRFQKHYTYDVTFVGKSNAIVEWTDKWGSVQEAAIHKSNWDMYIEYTPPVVHKRYVHVYKDGDAAKFILRADEKPDKYTAWVYVKTVPIEYTEAP